MPDDRFLHSRAGHSVKVSGLTDFEYRVWTQYLLSADDFGVMRASAVTMQSDNDALSDRPAKVIEKAVQRLVTIGLLRTFEHQGRTYLYQHDWQSWQKIGYPRKTKQPRPEGADFDVCDFATQRLFGIHPGGDGKKFTKGLDRDSGKVSEKKEEELPTTRAGATRELAMANGKRPMADAGGGPGEPTVPYDAWFLELHRLYPPSAVSGGLLTMQAFTAVFLERETARPPADVWADMRSNLETQKAGAQWRDGKIPRLDRWLTNDLWQQRHEAIEAPRENATPAQPAWRCPHVDACHNPRMCDFRLSDPVRFPVRQAVPA